MLFNFARQVPQFWLFIAIALYLFFIYGHIPVSDICYALRDSYSEPVYTATIQLIGKVLVVVHLAWLGYRLSRPKLQYFKLFVWTIFALTLAALYNQLVVFAIEYIHFMQYCLFTCVLLRLFDHRILPTIITSLIAGFLDEVYQAYHPGSPLNWRDISLNAIGVLWGYLVIWSNTNTESPQTTVPSPQ